MLLYFLIVFKILHFYYTQLILPLKISLFLRSRGPACESLLYLAIARAFGESARAVARHHSAPECHRARMAHVFYDFPIAREAVKNERRSVPADTGAPVLHAHEKLGHSVVRGLFARLGDARPRDQRKSDGVGPFQDQQRVRLIVGKPVREYFGLVRIVRADDGK